MKTALLYLLPTLVAVALADKPSPSYSHATSVAASPSGDYASPQSPAKEAEPVAPSTQGFYYYYYPVASSYTDGAGGPQRPGYGGGQNVAPDRQEATGVFSGVSGPFLGVLGTLAVVAVGAAVFMSGGAGRRSFEEAFSAVDFDDVAYYVYEGIRLWTAAQGQ